MTEIINGVTKINNPSTLSDDLAFPSDIESLVNILVNSVILVQTKNMGIFSWKIMYKQKYYVAVINMIFGNLLIIYK